MPLSAYPSSPAPVPGGLLQPGRNCWRIERACRFAMLVDAAAYFRALRLAIREARNSVFILSWDIDSRTCLVPEGANDGYPEQLGDFLQAVVAERPQLQVYVLNWDFAVLYALEREWLPLYKAGWSGERRLAFQMDGRHPIGASHHQKVVVIDDALAFVGGLDPTRCRWDTPAHAHNTPWRRDADGKPYEPFHDVQAMVDGGVARALGELARVRWRRATGQRPAPRIETGRDLWPIDYRSDLTDIDVAITRTEPAFEGRPGVYETRQLHLDAIANAQRWLFFENQYFTSDLICNALSARLAEAEGPEVIVVSPRTQSGWLEEVTMGVLRTRVHRRLRAVDQHGRYGLYCPRLPELHNACLNVHSKVFAMDDDLFSIGSANLSNRSMAFDTECNLAIEANGSEEEKSRIRKAIARLRNRLLAEHLGVSPERVSVEIESGGSLHGAVKALHRPGRSLIPLEPTVTPELNALIPEQVMFDPERPINQNELLAQLLPKDARRPVSRRLVGLGALAIVLALLAIAWRWTPLGAWLNLDSMVAFAQGLEASPFAPIAVVCSYVIAGLLVVPVTLLIAVTGIVFGPVLGTSYALAGVLLSAAATYGIGQWLGRDAVRQLLGARINRLSRRIAKRGILAVIVIRMLPVAPFSVVNVVAGASHIRFRDYMIGTLFGMLPGTVITVTFVHHLAQAVRNPSVGTLTVLAVVVVLLLGSAIGLQRLFAGKGNNHNAETQ